jgi:DNA-directed RNA polymerase subunit F
LFEIRICPETPTELKAVLQLVQTLAVGPSATPHPAPIAAPPASATEDPANAEDVVSIDILSPPGGKPDLAYSAQQVLEALQDFARVNGAAALKKVLDRFGARRVSDITPEQYAEVMTIAQGEEG